jgi:hypothetical protein
MHRLKEKKRDAVIYRYPEREAKISLNLVSSHPVCTILIGSFPRIRLHEVEVHLDQLKAPKSLCANIWIFLCVSANIWILKPK